MSKTADQDARSTEATRRASPKLLKSLETMLEAYWGEGDGMRPPQFILDAQAAVAEAKGEGLVSHPTPARSAAQIAA